MSTETLFNALLENFKNKNYINIVENINDSMDEYPDDIRKGFEKVFGCVSSMTVINYLEEVLGENLGSLVYDSIGDNIEIFRSHIKAAIITILSKEEKPDMKVITYLLDNL